GRLDSLVVGGRRRAWSLVLAGLVHRRRGRAADHPLDRGHGEPLEAGDREVPIEVVAVRRVDPGAQPGAGVGELDTRSTDAGQEFPERTALHPDAMLEPQRRGAVEAAALEPLVEEVVVVVPGNDDELRVAQHLPDLAVEGARRVDVRVT